MDEANGLVALWSPILSFYLVLASYVYLFSSFYSRPSNQDPTPTSERGAGHSILDGLLTASLCLYTDSIGIKFDRQDLGFPDRLDYFFSSSFHSSISISIFSHDITEKCQHQDDRRRFQMVFLILLLLLLLLGYIQVQEEKVKVDSL